jgi:hypothetical protein
VINFDVFDDFLIILMILMKNDEKSNKTLNIDMHFGSFAGLFKENTH